ncbi:hypothetical protein [Salinarimonas rosea]|uniref:hypothetical protein n=1 Tax=Salinarimonas rosea TaxID=552063 RepID=UPI0004238F8B|nr:hypothetical protein [Salinarimonas rosea]
MSEIAHRFCKHATIVAVITLIAGIAVALDAIGSARACPRLAEVARTCGPEMLSDPLSWPAASRAPQPAEILFRRG